MVKYFIWTPAKTPQIWFEKPVDGSGKAKPTLACIELDDSDKRTIDILKLAIRVQLRLKNDKASHLRIL